MGLQRIGHNLATDHKEGKERRNSLRRLLNEDGMSSTKKASPNVKAVYCHPVYLTYMQSTSRETLDWKKHKLESRYLGEISITSDMQMIPPLWQKVKRN